MAKNSYRVSAWMLCALLLLPAPLFAVWSVTSPSSGSTRTKNMNVAGTGSAMAPNLAGVLKFGTAAGMENEQAFMTYGMASFSWDATVVPPTGGWNVSPAVPGMPGMRQADHICWIEYNNNTVASTTNHTVTP